MSALTVVQGGLADTQTRFPPSDAEAEALIIGTLLWGNAALAVATFREILKPETFFSEAHRQTFVAACAVADAFGADAVELGTITAKLTEAGRLPQVGGPPKLVELRNATASYPAKRFREWAIAVHDAWRRRRAIAIAQTVEAQGYLGVESTQGYIDEATRKLLWLANSGHGRAEESNRERLDRLFRQAEARRAARESNAPVDGVGAPFDLPTLNTFFRGMRPGKKITFVARPGLGKSALAMQALLSAARAGVGAVYYAAEPGMDLDDHMHRLMAAVSHVECSRLTDGMMLDREIGRVINASDEISKLPLVLVDARGWDVDRLESDAQRRANTFRVLYGTALGVIAADHVHAFAAPERMSRQATKKFEVVSYTTTRLAEIGSKLGVCVIELAQEKRGEQRRGKPAPPKKDDVSDSSEIEKSTSAMAFLRNVGEANEDGVQRVRLFVVKNRDGRNDVDADLEFVAPELRFLEAYRP